MIPPHFAEDLFRHLESLDPYGATQVVRDAVGGGESVESVITDVLVPTQERVGERWQCGRWTIAQEHAATAIVDDLLGLLAARIPLSQHGSVALVSAEGEWHVTPARMAALLWRAAGWQVTFLGGSTPPDHLRTTLGRARPDLVAVSCTVPLGLPGAGRVGEALQDLGVPIMGGGAAFGTDPHRAEALGLSGWASSATEAPEVFHQWMDRPPDRPERLRTDDEELSLELQMPELVTAAERRLLQRFPAMRSYDAHQRARTREDLGYILRFAAVSLLLDDDRLFRDFIVWLPEVLRGHGVPAEAVTGGVDALLGVIRDLPRTAALLESGYRALERIGMDVGQGDRGDVTARGSDVGGSEAGGIEPGGMDAGTRS
jgi:methanogenic corrinoid protein MtbC1